MSQSNSHGMSLPRCSPSSIGQRTTYPSNETDSEHRPWDLLLALRLSCPYSFYRPSAQTLCEELSIIAGNEWFIRGYVRAILHQRIGRCFIEALRRTESREYQKRRFMCGVFGGVYVHREVGLGVADSNGAVKLQGRACYPGVIQHSGKTPTDINYMLLIQKFDPANLDPNIPPQNLFHV